MWSGLWVHAECSTFMLALMHAVHGHALHACNIATLHLAVEGEFDPNMETLASSKTSVRYADGVYHVRNKFVKIIVAH
jgi:hypothetical protein